MQKYYNNIVSLMRTIIGTGSELNVPIILIEDDSNYLICNNLKNNANKEEVPRFPLNKPDNEQPSPTNHLICGTFLVARHGCFSLPDLL